MSYARHLPVLMYHHVSDKPRQINLSPRTFRAQMKWLVESGWITGCRYFRCMQEFNLHAHLFLVTCLNSDGAIRILAGEPVYSHDECQMLVKQGRADEVMLCWSKVREMHLSGLVAFHSHTYTHRRWDHKPVSSNPSDLLRVDIILRRKQEGDAGLLQSASVLAWGLVLF